MGRYKYVIKVNGRKVWEGRRLKGEYWEIKARNPKAKVTVAVVATRKETLILVLAPV